MFIHEDSCSLCRRDDCDFITRCGHKFHHYCIRERILYNPTCHRCKVDITDSRDIENHVKSISIEIGVGDVAPLKPVKELSESEKNAYLSTFIFSCRIGNMQLFNNLLEVGIDINAKDKNHVSALSTAIMNGSLEIFDKLIDLGIDINAKDEYHVSALSTAINNESLEIVDKLIDLGAEINVLENEEDDPDDELSESNQLSPLHHACRLGNLKLVKRLVERGADVDCIKMDFTLDDWVTPLHVASASGFLEIVDFLSDLVSDINCQTRMDEYTALHFAVLKGESLGIVRRLLASGADPLLQHHDCGCALLYVCGRDNVALFEEFAMCGDERIMRAAFSYSVFFGCIGIFSRCIELSVDINSLSTISYFLRPISLVSHGSEFETEEGISAEGMPALHVAASRGHLVIVDKLIELGADANARDFRGKTPLDYAIQFDQEEVIKRLQDKLKV